MPFGQYAIPRIYVCLISTIYILISLIVSFTWALPQHDDQGIFSGGNRVTAVPQLTTEYLQNNDTSSRPTDQWDSISFSLSTSLLPSSEQFFEVSFAFSTAKSNYSSLSFALPSYQSLMYSALTSTTNPSSDNQSVAWCGAFSRLFYDTQLAKLYLQVAPSPSERLYNDNDTFTCHISISNVYFLTREFLRQNQQLLNTADYVSLQQTSPVISISILSNITSTIVAQGSVQATRVILGRQFNQIESSQSFVPAQDPYGVNGINVTFQWDIIHDEVQNDILSFWNIDNFSMREFYSLLLSPTIQLVCQVPEADDINYKNFSIPPTLLTTIDFIFPKIASAVERHCQLSMFIRDVQARPFTINYSFNSLLGRLPFVPSFSFSDPQLTSYSPGLLSWSVNIFPNIPNGFANFTHVLNNTFSGSFALLPQYPSGELRTSTSSYPSCIVEHRNPDGTLRKDPVSVQIHRKGYQLFDNSEPIYYLLFDYPSFTLGQTILIQCSQAITRNVLPPLNDKLIALQLSDTSGFTTPLGIARGTGPITIDHFNPSNIQLQAPWPVPTALDACPIVLRVTSSAQASVIAPERSWAWILQQVLTILQRATVPTTSTTNAQAATNIFADPKYDMGIDSFVPVFGSHSGVGWIDPVSTVPALRWNGTTIPTFLPIHATHPGFFASIYIPLRTFAGDNIDWKLVQNYSLTPLWDDQGVLVQVDMEPLDDSSTRKNSVSALQMARSTSSLSLSSLAASPTVNVCSSSIWGYSQRPDFSNATIYSPGCPLGLGDRCFSSFQCPDDANCVQNTCNPSWVSLNTSFSKSVQTSLVSSRNHLDSSLFPDHQGLTMSSSPVPVNDNINATTDTLYQGTLSCRHQICSEFAKPAGIIFTFVHSDTISANITELQAQITIFDISSLNTFHSHSFNLTKETHDQSQKYDVWAARFPFSTYDSPFSNTTSGTFGFTIVVARIPPKYVVPGHSAIFRSPVYLDLFNYQSISITRRAIPAMSTDTPPIGIFERYENNPIFTTEFSHDHLGPLNPHNPEYSTISLYPVGLLQVVLSITRDLTITCQFQGQVINQTSIVQQNQENIWYYILSLEQSSMTLAPSSSRSAMTCSWTVSSIPSLLLLTELFATNSTASIGFIVAFEKSASSHSANTFGFAFLSHPQPGFSTAPTIPLPLVTPASPSSLVSLGRRLPEASRSLRLVPFSANTANASPFLSSYNIVLNFNDVSSNSAAHSEIVKDFTFHISAIGPDLQTILYALYEIQCYDLTTTAWQSSMYPSEPIAFGMLIPLTTPSLLPNIDDDPTIPPLYQVDLQAAAPIYSNYENLDCGHLAVKFFINTTLAPYDHRYSTINDYPTSFISQVVAPGITANHSRTDLIWRQQVLSGHLPSNLSPLRSTSTSQTSSYPTITLTASPSSATTPLPIALSKQNVFSVSITAHNLPKGSFDPRTDSNDTSVSLGIQVLAPQFHFVVVASAGYGTISCEIVLDTNQLQTHTQSSPHIQTSSQLAVLEVRIRQVGAQYLVVQFVSLPTVSYSSFSLTCPGIYLLDLHDEAPRRDNIATSSLPNDPTVSFVPPAALWKDSGLGPGILAYSIQVDPGPNPTPVPPGPSPDPTPTPSRPSRFSHLVILLLCVVVVATVLCLSIAVRKFIRRLRLRRPTPIGTPYQPMLVDSDFDMYPIN